MRPIFSKPEYVFRPRQALRRFQLQRGALPAETVTRLAWGDEIEVDPREMIGSAICRMGVYDLVVVEAIWRLTDREDVALDIGANIGAMTSAFLARCDRVWAYEPHPELFKRLERNGARWATDGRLSLSEAAVSSFDGIGHLRVPSDFSANSGTAALASEGVSVQVVTLDGSLPPAIVPTIAKVDVESHEMAVLEGGDRTFGRLRDVVFEAHDPYPTEITFELERRGFRIFRLEKRLLRPALVAAGSPPRDSWDAQSFLATREPGRASSRFEKGGWWALARS
jgi:FkbM family methyltransferase